MKLLQLQYEQTCLIDKQKLVATGQKLIPEIERIKVALNRGYDTAYAALNLVNDRDVIKNIKIIAREKKKLSISTIVLIGIGGSNLGTMAVQQAILGKYYNICDQCTKILYADTVDPDYLHEIIDRIETDLKKGNNVLFVVVSKSGTTLETIANFAVLLQVLKHYRMHYGQHVVCISDKDSPLWQLGKSNQWALLEIPPLVGGRYSVFSAVSLFPLALLDIDIATFKDGGQQIASACLDTTIEKNPAALCAIIKYLHWQEKRNIHDLFLFSVSLENVGKWYRQLMAESIGKEYTKDGKKISVGITPIVSIGSTDLHSVGQLDLEGPDDKYTTFISIESTPHKYAIPQFPALNNLVPHIQEKNVSRIMEAIVLGTKNAYKEKERPFVSVLMPEKTTFFVGQFLQLSFYEMIYLAYLLDVDPFDQPGVETYKAKTREILAYE